MEPTTIVKKKRNRRFRRRKSNTTSSSPSRSTNSNQLEGEKTLVVNLSDKLLTSSETNLLKLGLSFCPSPAPPRKQQILEEILSFDRKSRLNFHFKKAELQDSQLTQSQHSQTQDRSYIKKRDTGWTPNKGLNQQLDTFLGNVQNLVTNHDYTPKGKHNLDARARAALKRISLDQDIIIKPADKGGAVVILNRTDYIKESNKLLQNRDHYRQISQDFTPIYTKQIAETLQQMTKEGLINKDTQMLLTPRQPRTPVFYILPKIHKKGNPGRPIVSAVTGPTDQISRYVDNQIRPLVCKIDSYVKDTTHMDLKINQTCTIYCHTCDHSSQLFSRRTVLNSMVNITYRYLVRPWGPPWLLPMPIFLCQRLKQSY